MSFGGLLLIGLDPLVDFLPVGAVVAEGGLDEAEGDLEIACCLGASPALSRTAPMISQTSLPVPTSLALRPAGPPANRMSGCSSIRRPSSTYRCAGCAAQGAHAARACLDARSWHHSGERSADGSILPAQSVTNQVTTAPGDHRCSATQPDTTMPLTCSNAI